jgi:cytochrome c-type biogenesis protein CcmE
VIKTLLPEETATLQLFPTPQSCHATMMHGVFKAIIIRSAMTKKQSRFALIVASLLVVGFAVGIILFAVGDSIVYFYTPSDVAEKNIQPGTRIRLGGMVQNESWKKSSPTLNEFVVTDTLKTIKVNFKGLVPDLFREGQGVVTEGIMQPDGTLLADQVLAKHDENYMPKEVAEKMKARGVKLGKSAGE